MNRPISIKQMVRDLERKKVRLAKLRDELRDLESEISGHSENADEALASLECAIDHLSELV